MKISLLFSLLSLLCIGAAGANGVIQTLFPQPYVNRDYTYRQNSMFAQCIVMAADVLRCMKNKDLINIQQSDDDARLFNAPSYIMNILQLSDEYIDVVMAGDCAHVVREIEDNGYYGVEVCR